MLRTELFLQKMLKMSHSFFKITLFINMSKNTSLRVYAKMNITEERSPSSRTSVRKHVQEEPAELVTVWDLG